MRKKVFSLMALALVLTGLIGCGMDLREPGDYYSEVGLYYDNIDVKIVDLAMAVSDEEVSLTEYFEILDACDTMVAKNLEELKKIEPMKDDQGYLQSIISFNENCLNLLNNNYKEIGNIWQNLDENTDNADEDINRISVLEEEAFNAILEKETDVTDKADAFAEQFNIELVGEEE